MVSDIAWGDNINNPKIKGDDLEPKLNKIKNKYPEKVIIIKGSWNRQFHMYRQLLNTLKQISKKLVIAFILMETKFIQRNKSINY